VHFHFQVSFVGQRRPLGEAAATAARKASHILTALGVPRPDHRVLATLHLLELIVRHEEARSS
jgi:hypothetical protein